MASFHHLSFLLTLIAKLLVAEQLLSFLLPPWESLVLGFQQRLFDLLVAELPALKLVSHRCSSVRPVWTQKIGPYFWLFLQPLVFLPFLLLVVGHFAWGVRPEIGLLHQIPEPSHPAGRLDNRSVTLDPTSWHSQMVGCFAWEFVPRLVSSTESQNRLTRDGGWTIGHQTRCPGTPLSEFAAGSI